MQSIESLIEDAFERRNELTQAEIETHLRPAVEQVINLLESGERRVAEPDGKGGWTVNQWIKKAVLLYFRINGNQVVDGGPALAFDKVPLRFAHGNDAELQGLGARVVPGALVRRGAHVAKDAVLMPYGAGWPGADVRLQAQAGRWVGIGEGSGRLRARPVEVAAGGRGPSARPRTATLWLPAEGGGLGDGPVETAPLAPVIDLAG